MSRRKPKRRSLGTSDPQTQRLLAETKAAIASGDCKKAFSAMLDTAYTARSIDWGYGDASDAEDAFYASCVCKPKRRR